MIKAADAGDANCCGGDGGVSAGVGCTDPVAEDVWDQLDGALESRESRMCGNDVKRKSVLERRTK